MYSYPEKAPKTKNAYDTMKEAGNKLKETGITTRVKNVGGKFATVKKEVTYVDYSLLVWDTRPVKKLTKEIEKCLDEVCEQHGFKKAKRNKLSIQYTGEEYTLAIDIIVMSNEFEGQQIYDKKLMSHVINMRKLNDNLEITKDEKEKVREAFLEEKNKNPKRGSWGIYVEALDKIAEDVTWERMLAIIEEKKEKDEEDAGIPDGKQNSTSEAERDEASGSAEAEEQNTKPGEKDVNTDSVGEAEEKKKEE